MYSSSPPFLPLFFLSLHLSFVSIHLFIFHPPVCLLFYSSSLFFLTLFYFPLLHPCVLFRFINRSYTLLFVFVCLSLSYSSHCFLFSLFFPATRHLAESLLEATLRRFPPHPPTSPSLHTSHSKFSSCCTFVSLFHALIWRTLKFFFKKIACLQIDTVLKKREL